MFLLIKEASTVKIIPYLFAYKMSNYIAKNKNSLYWQDLYISKTLLKEIPLAYKITVILYENSKV